MKPSARTTAAVCLLAAAGMTSAAAQDDATDRPLHCLNMMRIDHTDILDSRHMLFTMTTKRLYLNTLPAGCAGMRPHDPYLTRTSLTQLCDLDIITVLHQTGFGFMPGASCGLGMFQPVTQHEVDLLKQQIRSKDAKHH